jgi:hypothetical protein
LKTDKIQIDVLNCGFFYFGFLVTVVKATPPVLSMQIKIGCLEKSKHASLAQQNGFGPAFLQSLLRLV